MKISVCIQKNPIHLKDNFEKLICFKPLKKLVTHLKLFKKVAVLSRDSKNNQLSKKIFKN